MINERLNRMVGLAALFLVVSSTTAVLMVGDRPLVAAVHFTILFDRVGRLRPGASVRMNNLDLGRVESITYEQSNRLDSGESKHASAAHSEELVVPSGSAPALSTERQFHQGRVRVVVWVRRSHRDFVRKNSRFLITATSLIGARHVEILPPRGEPGPVVVQGDEVVGEPPPHIDRMLRMAYENLKRSTDLLNRIRPDLEMFGRQTRQTREILASLEKEKALLGRTWQRGRSAYGEWDRDWRILARATRKGRDIEKLVERLAQTSRHISSRSKALRQRANRLRAKLDRVGKNWKTLQAHPLRRRLDRDIRHVRLVVRRIGRNLTVVERAVRQARGTVGALMRDHEIWDDFKESQRIIKQRIWTILGKGKQSSPEGYPVP